MMAATREIRPGSTGKVQSTAAQSCLPWEAGNIICLLGFKEIFWERNGRVFPKFPCNREVFVSGG